MQTTNRRILTGVAMIFALPLAWSHMHVAALRQVDVELDSGHLGNSGTEEQVVFSKILEVPDALSVRVLFEAIQLQESSYVRLRSLDGSTQVLRQETLEADVKESVSFRGSRVELELVAAPGTEYNFVVVRTILAAETPPADEPDAEKGKDGQRRPIVCSRVDGRAPSRDAAVGRLHQMFRNATGGLEPDGCTASIVGCEEFEQPDARVLLTARHCFVKPALTLASAEVQFDPPLSTATCVEQPAIPGKTFSVLTQTIRSGVTAAISGGPFDGWTTDWAVFRTLRNSTTKKTPYQEQGAHYKTDPTGAQFNDTTIIGFGTDGGNPDAAIRRDRHCADCWSGYADSNLNRTQQTHSGSTGPLYRMENVFYTTHTCGGNSGSLLLQPRIVDGRFERRVVGVHTGFVTNVGDNGCVGDVPINRGTNIAHAPFRARISEVCNMCDANNDKRVDNADLADIRNALGLGAAGRQRMNPDNDAQVTVNDLRLCSLMCTNANCQ